MTQDDLYQSQGVEQTVAGIKCCCDLVVFNEFIARIIHEFAARVLSKINTSPTLMLQKTFQTSFITEM